ncbi:MAG TPA: AAA family ATPase [Pirellulales bacterium]|nr:AAA family ATPase [Pirellulales bacterium]
MTAEPSTIAAPPSLPDWYPSWAKELADLYFSGTTCLFVLNGNVHDLIAGRAADGDGETYSNLAEFLATQVFGTWDIVLDYDLGRGLRPLAGGDSARLKAMLSHLSGRLGETNSWPRDAEAILALLDRFIERSLVDDAENRKRIAIIFDYAQYLVPAGDPATMAKGEAGRLVRMLGWAQNPYIKRANVAFCLVSEKLNEINDRLVQNPHVAAIKIPMPERDQRERFVRWVRSAEHQGEAQARQAPEKPGLPPDQLAEMTSGLSLVSLNVLVSQEKRDTARADAGKFKELKKTLIERQCQGLVEFVEPKHTLDMVVGHEACRRRLREDADWIGRGQLDAAPMGYLITGPVGTGKTFLAECYAGSIGIPCVTLRNFRSKYVGETEGNLEQVLTVLRSLGPVVVIIDEADAALGNRRAEGDSGTSSRVFSMIAGQMGDTSYRGKIVWMLLTSRPDLLPIDLKRQGRAEVHIPLFYPLEQPEFAAMFQVMARKNKVKLAADAVVEVPADRHLSGADIESVVLAAKRAALTAGRGELSRADLRQALEEFIPSAQGLEKELQEIAAVLECSQLSFLPERWRTKVAEPNGRSQLQERLVAIRQLLEE